MKAILFGSIGVFCDSSEMQRTAYNQSFSEAGLDWYWDAPLYKKLLLTPGGLARVSCFADEYDKSNRIDIVAIHRRKTALFAEMLENQKQTIRSGVVRLIKSAQAQNIKVGWVTSTERSTLEVIINRSEGALSQSDFDVITHRSTPVNQKPDPSPYLTALAHLGIQADEAVAIEDTAACMRSATRAEIACVVTPHSYSHDQDYYEAVSVATALGDPGSAASIIAGAPIVNSQGLVTIEALQSVTEGVVDV